VRPTPRQAFFWHAFFLAVTTSFTEVNTVMPALVMQAGGTAAAVGVLTAIMYGLPLVSQLLFASFLHTRKRKKPFLLLGINLRVLALAGAAAAIAFIGTDARIIPAVFIAMAVFSLSGAFAGVSYTELMGNLLRPEVRLTFFVRRQVITTAGLLVSAIVTYKVLGPADFPDGYVLLFAMASAFLFVASGGFWALHEPPTEPEPVTTGDTPRPKNSMLAALRQTPAILREDSNLRTLIYIMNLVALGFTSIPLITALAKRSYDLSPAMTGTFVMVQIGGMLLAAPLWSRLIRRGGYRLLLRVEVLLIAGLFPTALVLAATAPIEVFAGLYLVTGAIVSAQKISIDGALVQISPDGRRALYAGVFGAANLTFAVLPLLTGVLIGTLGYPAVFLGVFVATLFALIPVKRLSCGDWYLNRGS
jgi:MFS family permease